MELGLPHVPAWERDHGAISRGYVDAVNGTDFQLSQRYLAAVKAGKVDADAINLACQSAEADLGRELSKRETFLLAARLTLGDV